MVRLAMVRLAIAASCCLVAACATTTPPPASDWVRQDTLRSCLRLRIPPELVRAQDPGPIAVSMELSVLPSGRIESASVITDPGNAALDTFLAEQLVGLPCAPFEPVQALYAYPVSLHLQIQSPR
jgi:hypothetical protein